MKPLETFERHRDWATALAVKFRFPRSVERGDVVSAALGGLWQASIKLARLHLPDHEFQRAAYPRVRGSVRDMLRATNWVKRAHFTAGLRIQLDFEFDMTRLSAPEIDDDGIDDETHERLMAVERAIARLRPVDRRALLECVVGDRPQHELAAELGVSPPRISQRIKHAIATVRADVLSV